MNNFKRYDCHRESIPQSFIDQQLPVCPLCAANAPQWTMRERVNTQGNRYLFRCEECGCVLSSPVKDVVDFVRTLAESGTRRPVSLTVEELGDAPVEAELKSRSVELAQLQSEEPLPA